MPARRKGEPLMRDLHATTEEIDSKIPAGKTGLDSVQGLREKVDRISEQIQIAEKDKGDRVGQVEKDIASHELKAISAALLKYNKVPVDAFEIKELRKLERSTEEENAKKKQKLATEVAEKVNAQVRFNELQFAEKFAETQAKEVAFQAERKTLTETIEALRLEIESQKKLTGDIAKAAAQPPPIQQITKA
eukprot:TRINITY_DN33501_c0_g1_i1.p2 TRINITY_DN33501_c0_g1~~TRINITY_DN33501_c0_g1_i1.p2  ORF type:complete len:191 (+),score=68.67 TRINITY_DN33501_c0_g1_i1:67-639(+)